MNAFLEEIAIPIGLLDQGFFDFVDAFLESYRVGSADNAELVSQLPLRFFLLRTPLNKSPLWATDCV